MQRIIDIFDADVEKQLFNQEKLPPIEKWQPEHVIPNDMQIDSSGRWFHEGDEIKRLPLCQLFASILKKEDEDYFLITPREKFPIQVDDVPFVMVSLNSVEHNGTQLLVFTNNLNQTTVLDQNHAFEVRDYKGVYVPYIQVRNDLYARLSRSCFYQLVEEYAQMNTEQNRYFIESDNKKYYLRS